MAGFARRVDRVEELSKRLAGKKGRLYAVKADITVEQEVVDAFRWTIANLGPVHVLVNNAGIAQHTSLADGETDKWRRVLDTNVLGLCVATREALRVMKEHRIAGHVVHVSSIAGHKVPDLEGLNVYSASKYAVRALAETLKNDLRREKSQVKVSVRL